MSWSGPAAGTAQHQPPPYVNGQPGYNQQQQFQYGQQAGYGQYQGGPAFPQSGPSQRPPENRPPKKKGNPIITRYPPPPGYRGPAQPQGPYGTNQYPNQYQPPPQGYPQGYSGYSPQGYAPPQSYPQQPNYQQNGYPQGQNYPYPQQGYPPNQGYSQAPSYQGNQGYAPQQGGYPGYPPPSGAPVDPNQQAYSQAQGWQPPSNISAYPPSDQYNLYGPPPMNGPMNGHPANPQDPNMTPTPTSAQPATTQNTPTQAQPNSATSEQGTNEKPQLFLGWDDWDFDFDGAIWPKGNEPIDSNLSLGVIIWRPAKQVTRALPSTYEDAEEQALKPPAEKLNNAESVSIYFTQANSHQAFLDVRDTSEWRKIKNDPIFVVFPDDKDMDLIPIEDCISKRDRPDEQLEEIKVEEEDEEMEDSTWNVMDNLEQALSGQDADVKPQPPPTNTEYSRDKKQEDILAMLGVTGSPKPPSNDPPPHLLPSFEEKAPASLPEKPPAPQPRPEPPAQRSNSYSGYPNSNYGPPPQRPYGSMSSSAHTRPPPPPPAQNHFDSWTSGNPQSHPNGHALDGARESPARSEGSNRTLAGSDFETEKPSTSNGIDKAPAPEPKLHRSDSSFSRKRSYDDTDQDDEKLRQQDDHTRRKRRQPQVEAAYRCISF
ncbi:hypothetical protein K469DRAFT_768460 [Zopfia rhizophila CBS 207.26]|uniref:Uncharacterized protein n=1 Tax=Zopfia rhizophila CBS 207.26 TaxID=1314779 RepID=A0A6A6EC28_9PEZI|nr:hypothetical protein K469DRAFT_768460 [Zopfia rhizophila CBS 207.26]